MHGIEWKKNYRRLRFYMSAAAGAGLADWSVCGARDWSNLDPILTQDPIA